MFVSVAKFKPLSVTAEEDSLWSSITNTSTNEDKGFGGSPGSDNISTNHTIEPPGITWDPFPDHNSQQKEEQVQKIEADDLLKTSDEVAEEAVENYPQDSDVIVAKQLGDGGQGDEEMDEALRESEETRRQLREKRHSFFNEDENVSFYATPNGDKNEKVFDVDVTTPELQMDGPPMKENTPDTTTTNNDDFSFYFPSQSSPGQPHPDDNMSGNQIGGSSFYDIMTPELPISPPPSQTDQPLVDIDNDFYSPKESDSTTVTVKDNQDVDFGDIFTPELPKLALPQQQPDLLVDENDTMSFDMSSDDLLSPKLPDTPPPLPVNDPQVATKDEKSPFYADSDFSQELLKSPPPVTENNLVNLGWTPTFPTAEPTKIEFSTKKVVVTETDPAFNSTPEISWPVDDSDKTLIMEETKFDSVAMETQPEVKTNEPQKENVQFFKTDANDILDASYQVYQISSDERDLRECRRVETDENIDTKPIDKHALIEKWETTMSASNDPTTEDREFISRRSLKSVNVYQEFGPVFRKKEAPKGCLVEVLTTTEEEDPELKRERLRKNVIAEQRVLKTIQVQAPWIAEKDDDDVQKDLKTVESIRQYEERKKKKVPTATLR